MSGLNQSTKSFFIGMINRQINEKIDSIKEGMKVKSLEAEIVHTWLEDNQLLHLYERYETLDKAYNEIRKERDNAMDTLRTEYRNQTNQYIGYGFDTGNIRQYALDKSLQKTMIERYPEKFAEIERLEKVKQNVEAVVLLQTSPTRLQEALKELLEKYGVDVIGMEDSIF